jgi:hypothetical protein
MKQLSLLADRLVLDNPRRYQITDCYWDVLEMTCFRQSPQIPNHKLLLGCIGNDKYCKNCFWKKTRVYVKNGFKNLSYVVVQFVISLDNTCIGNDSWEVSYDLLWNSPDG